MKFVELKKKKIKDLLKMEKEKKSELDDLRFSLSKGKKIKVHMIKALKKEVARIKTAINYRRKKLADKKKEIKK